MERENGAKAPVCVGLLAHVDAGKTTLSEAILYIGGHLKKAGRVDNGDAFLDTYELERKRGITIFSKQAVLETEKFSVTLMDTPGHADFGTEMERTLQILDYAILVISGPDGVRGNTETLWKLLEYYEIPVFLFVNKMDRPGTDREKIMEELHTVLSEECIDFTDTEGKKFYEALAVCSEGMMNAFLETGTVPERQIREEIFRRKVFPVCFGSALYLTGVEKFWDTVLTYTVAPGYPEDFGASVFKISRDSRGNRLTHLKITGGSLKVKEEINGEKVNQIRLYSGEKYETPGEVKAGTVCAVTGPERTAAGEEIGAGKESLPSVLKPVMTYGVILPPECDAVDFFPKLKELEEEEPALQVTRPENSGRIQIRLMGEVQTEILKQLIRDRFHTEVELDAGEIVYRETIADTVEGVGHFEPLRHYAEVHLLMEPGKAGSGLQFATDCSEDVLAKNWQRLILTHLKEKAHRGVLTGSVITDMKITLVSGKAHEKHTEGGDFRQAVYRAVRQGLMEAESVLLEPWYSFRLEVPKESVGHAMTDIGQRAGKFSGPEYEGERAVLTGTAPVSTMRDYAEELRKYTGGTGKMVCEVKGYYPCHNGEEVRERIGYDPDQDTENPSCSVFCEHGSGYTVPWDQVRTRMHLPGYFSGKRYGEQEKECTEPGHTEEHGVIGDDEVDRIFRKTFYANKREKDSPPRKEQPAESVYKKFRPAEKKPEYLLVDGYNVIFAWEELAELAGRREGNEVTGNLDAARGRLTDILCNYQALKGCEVILVFDAYRITGGRTEWSDYHNIHVVFTGEALTADRYIERFAHEKGKEYDITVATSDGMEQIITRGQGCRLISSRELKEEIEKVCTENLQQYRESGKGHCSG